MRFLKIIYLFSKTNNETIKRKFYIANKFMAPGFPNKWVSPDKVFPISLTMVFANVWFFTGNGSPLNFQMVHYKKLYEILIMI